MAAVYGAAVGGARGGGGAGVGLAGLEGLTAGFAAHLLFLSARIWVRDRGWAGLVRAEVLVEAVDNVHDILLRV